MRLQKYLADCGVASRRHGEKLIAEGRVAVNGQVVTQMGSQVEPGDTVTLDGQQVLPEAKKHYVLYHKPAGEVSTASDDKGRATVLDHFRDFPVRLYPVGRLDYDSEGLLLLTNDGELTQQLLHPSREVEKAYLARVAGEMMEEDLQPLRTGIRMAGDGRRTAPAKVKLLRRKWEYSDVMVILHEGRNRQVRRMFEAVGRQVLMLRRVRFGPLALGELHRGEWRELQPSEVQALRDAARGHKAQPLQNG